MLTIKQCLAVAYKRLPALEAELLLAKVLNKNQAWLLSHSDKAIDKKFDQQFDQLIRSRLDGQPLAYLTGFKEFYGHNFIVTPDVLIPRPDSELIITESLNFLKNKRTVNILDIGTGSGSLIITLALETKGDFNYSATDISTPALAIARENAQTLNCKINFIQSNLLESVPLQKFNLIIANLPYLTAEQMDEPTIQEEPSLALYGGKQGLYFYQQLLKQIKPYGADNCLMLLEINPNQEILLAKEISSPALRGRNDRKWEYEFLKDLSGHTRLAKISK